MPTYRTPSLLLLACVFLAVGCQNTTPSEDTAATVRPATCDADNGGLQLPDGFCAQVVADNLGRARHLAVRDNGDLYVALQRTRSAMGGLVALRDTDGDGRMDETQSFSEGSNTGLEIHNGYLYFAPDTAVYRIALSEGALVPSGTPELVVGGFLRQRSHASKPFTFDGAGSLYVTIGGPSNACQSEARTPGSAGLDPCPQLERQGGIWRFQADALNQTQEAHGHRYATGIRNAMAIAWNPSSQRLYAAQHGRDQLAALWTDMYTNEQSAELPSEELFLIEDGADFGWPYCYYDHLQGRKLLAPEFGGDGQEAGRCADKGQPITAFPGHWAPNDLLFYTGSSFPEHYRNGAFIAFHGSWNRAPLEQQGYNVAFVPFEGAHPSGDYEIFAHGFAGIDSIAAPSDAQHRPMGLALGPDGSLYISDSVQGRIWRIFSTGS